MVRIRSFVWEKILKSDYWWLEVGKDKLASTLSQTWWEEQVVMWIIFVEKVLRQ